MTDQLDVEWRVKQWTGVGQSNWVSDRDIYWNQEDWERYSFSEFCFILVKYKSYDISTVIFYIKKWGCGGSERSWNSSEVTCV